MTNRWIFVYFSVWLTAWHLFFEYRHWRLDKAFLISPLYEVSPRICLTIQTTHALTQISMHLWFSSSSDSSKKMLLYSMIEIVNNVQMSMSIKKPSSAGSLSWSLPWLCPLLSMMTLSTVVSWANVSVDDELNRKYTTYLVDRRFILITDADNSYANQRVRCRICTRRCSE